MLKRPVTVMTFRDRLFESEISDLSPSEIGTKWCFGRHQTVSGSKDVIACHDGGFNNFDNVAQLFLSLTQRLLLLFKLSIGRKLVSYFLVIWYLYPQLLLIM
jgi:hypothetical protein